MKKCLEKAQQEEAFRELLSIMGANGGRIPYGAVDKLVKTYHSNGYKAVTRDNLNYRLKKNKTCTSSVKDSLIGSCVTMTNRSIDVISDLSDQTAGLRDISNTASAPNDEAPNTSTNVTKVDGRKKGLKTNLVKENEKKGASHKMCYFVSRSKSKCKEERYCSTKWNSTKKI